MKWRDLVEEFPLEGIHVALDYIIPVSERFDSNGLCVGAIRLEPPRKAGQRSHLAKFAMGVRLPPNGRVWHGYDWWRVLEDAKVEVDVMLCEQGVT